MLQRTWIEDYSEDGNGGYWYEWDDGTGEVGQGQAEEGTGLGSNIDTGAGGTPANSPDYVTEITNPSLPGQTGYGWRYFSNGTAIGPDGKYYNQEGKVAYDPSSTSDYAKLIGLAKGAVDKLSTPAGIAGLLGTAASIATGANKPQTGGWKGTIPKLTAVRQQIVQPEYKPYSGQATMGGRAFTDVKYAATPEAVTAAEAADTAQAQGLAGLRKAAPAAQVAPTPPRPA